MKVAKPNHLEDTVEKLLSNFSTAKAKKMSADQLRSWAEQAHSALAEIQLAWVQDVSSPQVFTGTAVEDITELSFKMVSNVQKLADINTACRAAFSRWQLDETEREKNRLRHLSQLSSSLRHCLDKLIPKSSRIGIKSIICPS
jgi:hypothetical protein